jgi:ketosteroid isomerase-like protein
MHQFPKVALPSAVKILALSLLIVPMLVVSITPARSDEQKKPASSKASSSKEQQVSGRTEAVSIEITKTLQTQADAWNAGDLDKFMTAYLKSSEITFVSADGEMRGYDALESRYRKKYGTSRDTMGKLSFSDLQVRSLGKANALCIGHWLVERAGQPNLQGIFSLVLTEVNGGWKIIHDHTSVSPANQKTAS